MKEKALKLDSVESVGEFLRQPTLQIAEALTGILASDLKDWKLSAGKIVQSVIKGNLLTQLGREIKEYRQAGKIKENYLENDLDRASFKELLRFIDEEAPDEIRFKAVKSIFFSSLQGDSALAHELLQVCKKLSSMEVLILSANFKMVKGTAKPEQPPIDLTGSRNIQYWARMISRQIGDEIPELVLKHEKHLVELGLISDRDYPMDTTRVVGEFIPTPYFRLTTLGYKLCEFMTNYDE
jgi:hypothetical protein